MIRFLLGTIALAAVGTTMADPNPERARERMVKEIKAFAAGIGDQLRLSDAVLDALGKVPRHLFVPLSLGAAAYANRPLAIGHGQTISQPYIVALMTDLLEPRKDDVVLEVGTGSGYQAAVLAELVHHVYSIEIVAPLAAEAVPRLKRLGYDNVTVREGDGYAGWPEHAPFDAIIVTAGAPHIPPPLVEQLKPGGHMVIPVGATRARQELILVEKRGDGEIRKRNLGPVAFVPLTGARGE